MGVRNEVSVSEACEAGGMCVCVCVCEAGGPGVC